MVMKKFLNKPADITRELLEGLALAYPKQVKLELYGGIVVRAEPKALDKVAVVTLGGSGHEPALSGYVGQGMLDASIVGDIFAAPGAPRVMEALRLFRGHAGVLFVILNHAGDVMNGYLGLKMAEKIGVKVEAVLVSEDIASGIDSRRIDRRGLGGCVPLLKVAGAAAEAGKSLAEVVDITERFHANMATLAVTMKTATHPQSGQYISVLSDDMMEIGMGQHGEGGGTGPQKILSADETAEIMVRKLAVAIKADAGDKVFLIINGSGATTVMEMLIVFRKAHKVLAELGIEVVHGRCEEMLTVQEAAGFQMILGKLDAEMQQYLEAGSNAPYWVTQK